MKSLNGRTRRMTVWEDKTSWLNHSDPSMSRLKWRWSGNFHPASSNQEHAKVIHNWSEVAPGLIFWEVERWSSWWAWQFGTWWRPARFGLLLIVHPPSANHLRSSIFHHAFCFTFNFIVQDLCKLRIVPWLPLTSIFHCLERLGSWERFEFPPGEFYASVVHRFRGRDAAPLEAAWSQLSIQQIWKELGEMEGMTKRRSPRNMDKEWANHSKTHRVIGFGKRVFAECWWFEAHQPLRHYHSQVGPLDSHSTVRNHLSHGDLAAFGW